MKHFAGNIEPAVYAMEWRACARFPNYEVSIFGDLRYCRETTMRNVGDPVAARISSGGYVAYSIPDSDGVMRSMSAHQLVAEAFIGPQPGPGYEVAHRSGSKISAHYTHLRWATRAENHADIQLHGTAVKGTRNGRAKLTDEQALACREEYRRIKREGGGNKYGKMKALQEKYGLRQTALNYLGTGKTWQHLPQGEEI